MRAYSFLFRSPPIFSTSLTTSQVYSTRTRATYIFRDGDNTYYANDNYTRPVCKTTQHTQSNKP